MIIPRSSNRKQMSLKTSCYILKTNPTHDTVLLNVPGCVYFLSNSFEGKESEFVRLNKSLPPRDIHILGPRPCEDVTLHGRIYLQV